MPLVLYPIVGDVLYIVCEIICLHYLEFQYLEKLSDQTGLTKTAAYDIFATVNVLEKLVKPLVRRAPAGAFRYFRRYYGQTI